MRELERRIKKVGGRLVKVGTKHNIWLLRGVRLILPRGTRPKPHTFKKVEMLLRRDKDE
jgi:hypothetical protein